MSDVLDNEIRSILSLMVAEAPDPLSYDELAEQIVRPTPPRRRLSFGVAFGVAFAAIVAAVGAISFLLSPTDEGVGPSDAPPATALPPEGLSQSDWQRVPHDADVFGNAWMNSVVAGGPGLVAVGSTGNGGPEGVGDAAVWTSTDGVVWSRVPHNEAIFGGEGDQSMNSVIVGGPGLLAFGVDEGTIREAVVWASADGLTWTRIPDNQALTAAGDGRSVVVGGPGFVSVGEVKSAAAVWISADGLTWSRVPHDNAAFGLVLGDGNAMESVTVGGPGFVAVGSDGLHSNYPTGRARAVVWTSIDGVTWHRLPHDEAVFGGQGDQRMTSVTAGGPGLVAVGYDDDRPAVWTSTDGLVWSKVKNDPIGDGLENVTVGGPGLVAIGGDSSLWTSIDGFNWVVENHAFEGEDPGPGTVIAGGPGLVAIGTDGPNAAVWVWPTDSR